MSHNKATDAAFPTVDHTESGYPCVGEPGMTMREWYAGMALQGLIAADPERYEFKNGFAKKAFEMADAMLAEAAKEQP